MWPHVQRINYRTGGPSPTKEAELNAVIPGGVDPAASMGRLRPVMLATSAEYEREWIVERVNVGIAVARHNGTRFAGRGLIP